MGGWSGNCLHINVKNQLGNRVGWLVWDPEQLYFWIREMFQWLWVSLLLFICLFSALLCNMFINSGSRKDLEGIERLLSRLHWKKNHPQLALNSIPVVCQDFCLLIFPVIKVSIVARFKTQRGRHSVEARTKEASVQL